MAIPKLNLVGRRFGPLTVLESAGNNTLGRRDSRWQCRCDCGQVRVLTSGTLWYYWASRTTCSCQRYRSARRLQIPGSYRRVSDLTGLRFGRLVAVEFLGLLPTGPRNHLRVTWRCQCDCGNEKAVPTTLLGLHTNSCGCLRREVTAAAGHSRVRHGHAGPGRETPEYRAWIGMKQRCFYNHVGNYPNYRKYGARGIRICQQWLDSFEVFLHDVGLKPSRNHSLDRIDVNGHYEPSNVRWATTLQQAQNRRSCTCPHCEYHRALNVVQPMTTTGSTPVN